MLTLTLLLASISGIEPVVLPMPGEKINLPAAPDGGALPDKPPSTKSPEQSPAAQRPETTPPQRGFGAIVSLGGITEFGAHPSSMLGVTLGARIGGPVISGVIEGWTIFPTALIVSPTATLNAFSYGGTIGVCGEAVLLSGDILGCVIGRGGTTLLEGRNAETHPGGWIASAAGGLRLRGEWPRDSLLGFFISVEGFVPIIRTVVTAGDTTWKQPWVFGGGVIGLLLRFK